MRFISTKTVRKVIVSIFFVSCTLAAVDTPQRPHLGTFLQPSLILLESREDVYGGNFILFCFFFLFPKINFCKCIFSTAVKPLVYAVLNKKELKSGFEASVSIHGPDEPCKLRS